MSRLYKSRRLAALAACVGGTAVIAGLSAAGPAMASVTCQSPGYGSGATVQKIAQQSVWLTAGGWGAHSSCSSAGSITYTGTSAGQGLEEFGNSSGELQPEEDPTAFKSTTGTKDAAGQVLDWFVGTDDPPSAGQLSEAQAAAGAKKLAEITIPVAQAPVAVLLSLPTGCLIPSGSQVDVNNTTLGQLWEGVNKVGAAGAKDPGGIQAQGGYAIATWGALLTQLGYTSTATNPPTVAKTFFDAGGANGCGQAILAQVRENEAGTSYTFKNYNSQVNHSEWAQYADDFTNWPSSAVVESDPLSAGTGSQLNDSQSHISGNTAANPGSVGYSNTADAATAANGGFTGSATNSTFGTGTGGTSPAHQVLWAEVQNNGTSASGATYADPVLPASSIANCETTKLIPSDAGFPYSYTDSWSGIVATDPNISKDAGPSDYSICSLSYDLVWHHYSNANLFGKTATAENVANTVKDLFEYIVGQGQSEIESHDYTRIPTPLLGHVDQAVNPGIGF
jgi:hypothetical protein